MRALVPLPRRALTFVIALLLAAPAAAHRRVSDTESIVYNYVIAVGAFALIAVYIPLHALLHSRTRLVWQGFALGAAFVSGTAAVTGAALGGVLWQAIPTGVFMLFLALLIMLQMVGGLHSLRQRARAKGRVRVCVLDIGAARSDLEDGGDDIEGARWKDDISRDEYGALVVQSGVSMRLLQLGAESDQDAVGVALATGLYGGGRRASDEDGRSRAAIRSTAMRRPLHEPSGLLLLGSVPLARRWLRPLLDAVRAQQRARYAAVHHVCMFAWWVGMVLGAVAKTGFWRDKGSANESIRTAGIWIQAVLLVIAVYSFPFVRGVVRFGTRLWPRLSVLFLQSALSLGWGVCMAVLAREKDRKGNLIAYAAALVAAATAGAVWSVVAVWGYRSAERRLLGVPQEALDGERRGWREYAYVAALLTRPRYGYSGAECAVMRWGDVEISGQSTLEVALSAGTDLGSSSGGAEREAHESYAEEEQAMAEWDKLDHAAGRRWSKV
jgi:hypothetical protein